MISILTTDRLNQTKRFNCDDGLTDEEILTRYGLRNRPFTVDIHPDRRPDLTRRVQHTSTSTEGNRVWQTYAN